MTRRRPEPEALASASAQVDPGPDAGPPPADRRLVSATLGLMCGCALYVANLVLHLPVPLYVPQRGSWALQASGDLIAMRYYGGLIYLVAGCLAGSLLGRISRAARLGQGRAARLMAAAGAGTLLLAMAYVAVVELSHWSG
jgi:hypothetical protein